MAARLLLIASIVLGFGTAFLGFKTKQQADGLQEKLKTATSSLTSAKSTLAKTEKDLGETKKTLDETQATLKQKDADLVNAKAAAETAKADLTKAQAEVDEKSKTLSDIQAQLETLKKEFGEVKPSELAMRIKDLTDSKTRAETELAEARAVQESLKARADELTTSVETKERTIQEYKSNTVRQGLSGKIVAYNAGWNFVVLNIGDKAGLKAGVQMVVLRGGNMVGKLKVTSVETSTAIADVLPGTIARGDSVQPGDTVVFQGNRR
jgi:predicted  nucleic acid-binding Zn-ribbon protein